MPRRTRTESRVVRPFDSADAVLAHVRFKLSAQDDFDDRTLFDPSVIDRSHIRPEFLLHLDTSALGRIGCLTATDVALVIRIDDPSLHRSEVVFEHVVDDLPETYSVPEEVKDRFSWGPGLTASVALALKESRSPKPGLPFMRGQWVARRDFSLRSAKERRTFPIERWSSERFVSQGLPSDTVYWIDFSWEELNVRIEDPADVLRVCLRADVYDALVDAEEGPAGRAVMKLIEAEILAEVLWRGLGGMERGDQIERGSLLHSVVARVRKATGKSERDLREMVHTRRELGTIRALAQATVSARREVARLKAGG